MLEKRCSKCKSVFPHTRFNRSKMHRDGLYPSCKSCSQAGKKLSRELLKQRDVERWRQQQRVYKEKFRQRHPERVKLSDRKQNLKHFGLSIDNYTQLFEAQEGLCAICQKTQKRKLAVDHNHASGTVRALLCITCNLGLGAFSENTQSMRRATLYLRESYQ